MSAAALVRATTDAGLMIATSESCTGGGVAAAITEIAGASAVFDRGFVTYTNTAKQEMLGVSARTLQAHGAVSEEVAREMAQGALTRSNAGIAVSVTGIAGPGGSEHKPEGRVCFAWGTRRSINCETVEFGAIGRANVRAAACDHALTRLMDCVRAYDLP